MKEIIIIALTLTISFPASSQDFYPGEVKNCNVGGDPFKGEKFINLERNIYYPENDVPDMFGGSDSLIADFESNSISYSIYFSRFTWEIMNLGVEVFDNSQQEHVVIEVSGDDSLGGAFDQHRPYSLNSVKIQVDRQYLESKRNSGVSFRIYGDLRNIDTTITAEQINSFLSCVDSNS